MNPIANMAVSGLCRFGDVFNGAGHPSPRLAGVPNVRILRPHCQLNLKITMGYTTRQLQGGADSDIVLSLCKTLLPEKIAGYNRFSWKTTRMNATHIPMHWKWLAAGLAGLAVLMGSAGLQQVFAQGTNNYDTDNDNLIEVRTLEQLNAIRYDLDGNGAPTSAGMNDYDAAFPDPATPMCNTTCRGYELMADLDFDTNGSGEITEADNPLSWGNGSGWQPIGINSNAFNAEFNGNGHTISHLFIHSTGTDNVGLFGVAGNRAVIHSMGLIGVNAAGNDNVGGLVGQNLAGTIHASYATGGASGNSNVGGLVGRNNSGIIHASYATGGVSGNSNVGGLAGNNFAGIIHASYATGAVSGNSNVGGLVGQNLSGTIRASYATGGVSGISNVGGLVGRNLFSLIHNSYFDTNTSGRTGPRGRTTVALRSPTDYTGIYADWNLDVDNADADGDLTTGVDDSWDFGTSEQYPVLQVDFNGDGVKSWQEFGPQQSRPGVLVSPRVLSLTERSTETYTLVLLTTPTVSVMVRPESPSTETVSVSDELTFTDTNWNTAQTVAVHAVEDDNVVGERVSLMHTVVSIGNYASVTASNVTVNVTDNDSPVEVSTGTLSLMEGTTGIYTIVLLGMPTTSPVTVTPVSKNTTSVSVSGALIFTDRNWDTEQTVMVEALEDINTASEVVMLTHMVSEVPNYASVPAPVVVVNVTDDGIIRVDDEGGIRVRVRVFLEGPLR